MRLNVALKDFDHIVLLFSPLPAKGLASAGPFVVTSPNTFVSWAAFSQQTVTWNVANSNASPVNCANVDILLSLERMAAGGQVQAQQAVPGFEGSE